MKKLFALTLSLVLLASQAFAGTLICTMDMADPCPEMSAEMPCPSMVIIGDDDAPVPDLTSAPTLKTEKHVAVIAAESFLVSNTPPPQSSRAPPEIAKTTSLPPLLTTQRFRL